MRDYLQIHLVVLAWGFTAILGRWIELPPVGLVIWRAGLAVVGFAGVACWMGLRLGGDRRRILALMGTGLLLGWHWVLFFLAARLSTISVCLAALPTGMLWCSLIEPLVDGSRRWRWGELVVGVVMVGAVWLIYEVEFEHWLGLTVGLSAAVLAALYAVFTKQVVGRWSGPVIGFYQMLGAVLGVVLGLPLVGDDGGLGWPQGGDWWWLLVLAWGCTVGAYLGYLEPVYGIVLALVFFGEAEKMSGGFYVGATVIVGVVVALPWVRRRGVGKA